MFQLSYKSTTYRSCTITCFEQHQFPDGSGIANVFCKEGEWSPARPDWPTIPDCKREFIILNSTKYLLCYM